MARLQIICDVDVVVADLYPVWLGRYNRDWGQQLTAEDITAWGVHKFVVPECGEEGIRAYLGDPSLYDEMQPVHGALDGVNALRERGHGVTFATDIAVGSQFRKHDWLQEHNFLPLEPRHSEHYVEWRQKWRLSGDVIIDDKTETCERWAQTGRYAILFDAPHNRRDEITNPLILRARGWEHLIADVLPLVEARHDRLMAAVESILKEPEPAEEPPAGDPMKPSNPKDLIGDGKIPLHLFPNTAVAMGSIAMLNGLCKYGRDNFRAVGIRASVYVAALLRHTFAWLDGEDVDADGVPHLASMLACPAIIVDAKAAGKMLDDRKLKGGFPELMAELTPIVAHLKALHADKHPRHYSIADNDECSPPAPAEAASEDVEPLDDDRRAMVGLDQAMQGAGSDPAVVAKAIATYERVSSRFKGALDRLAKR